MSAWQDIATAPKDGTPILVGAFGYRPVYVTWREGHWRYPFTVRHLKAFQPTHWMLLPEPPEGSQ